MTGAGSHHSDMTIDDEPTTARGRRRKRQGEPTARQLAIPALVAFLSVVALVMFIYGFCNTVR